MTLLAQLIVNLTASQEVEKFTKTLKELESKFNQSEVTNGTEGKAQGNLKQVLAPITGAWSLVNTKPTVNLDLYNTILLSILFVLVLPGILSYYHLTRDGDP